ncbi:MAG: GTP cyclohydrolase I, partial [Lentisphaerae bacterium]|nr:GTP cyclohydrolase I [Lentisphaerota bacterium]
MNIERVKELVRELLIEIGEDPNREGLLKTPERVAKAYDFLSHGYRTNVDEVVNDAVFQSEANNMIICRNIEVYSMCEHHMLPFFGKCHIGYIASNRVIGLSKLARLADCFARRLQIQERLTAEIARAVMDTVDAEGV